MSAVLFAVVVGVVLVGWHAMSRVGSHGGREFRLGVATDPTTRQQQIRLDSLLHRLEAELGLRESPADGADLATAGGTVDGLFTKLHFGSRTDPEGTLLLTLQVEVAGGLPSTLSVGPENVRSSVQQRLAGPDFQLGDPDADDLLRLHGEDADLAALLSRPVARELRELVATGGVVDRGKLRCTLHPDPDRGYDLAEVVRWTRLARALALRPGERPRRLAAHLSPSFPAALRLAAAEALVAFHLNAQEVEAAPGALQALLDDPSLDPPHRARAARALAQYRAARGLRGDAGGLAVVGGAGGELAVAESRLSLTKD